MLCTCKKYILSNDEIKARTNLLKFQDPQKFSDTKYAKNRE